MQNNDFSYNLQQLNNNPENFPVWALGNTLSQVANGIQRESGASISAIATALAGTLSLVCQGRIEIEKCPGLVAPVSQWFLVAQPSGERKSAILNKVFSVVRAFVTEKSNQAQVATAQFEAEMKAWQAENKGLTDAIRKKSAQNLGVQNEQARLKEIATTRPTKPKRWRLVHEIATAQALLKNLAECHPTTSIVSDEASLIFDGKLMQFMGLLNNAYDGSDIASDTISGGEVIAVNPALSLLLFTQPEALRKFLDNRGEMAKGLGWLARCFVVEPPITAGYKFSSDSVSMSNPALGHYEVRIREILEDHADPATGEFKQKLTLRFTPEAQTRWNKFLDDTEIQMRPDGCFRNEKAFAAKLADKAARMAAVLHHFDGDALEIPLETLNRASVICEWYANEFLRIFTTTKQFELSKDQANAKELLNWLARFVISKNGLLFIVKKNDVLKSGPTCIRNKVDLDIALQILCQQGYFRYDQLDGKKTVWLALSRFYFSPTNVQQLAWQG